LDDPKHALHLDLEEAAAALIVISIPTDVLKKDIPDRKASNRDLVLSARRLRILAGEAVAEGVSNRFKQHQKERKGRRVHTFLAPPSVTNGVSLSDRKSPHTLNSLNGSVAGPIIWEYLPP
jgi:hypothetical protein